MTKPQWQADLEKDWPRLVAFANSFTPTGWIVVVICVAILLWMASQWITIVAFGFGSFVGYHIGKGNYDKLDFLNKKPGGDTSGASESKTT